MSNISVGEMLNILTGLGNGYDISKSAKPLLIGGGVGVPPMYYLAKKLIESGQKPTVIRPEHAKSRITPDGHTAKATYIVMLGTKSINARCGSLSASRKADGMKMSSPSRPYCAKHDTSCVRTKGYIIIAVDKALSPTPSVTRASMTFSRPTSRYIAHCPTIQTLTTRIWTMLTYICATIRSYEYNSVVPCASPNAKYHCAAPCLPVAR